MQRRKTTPTRVGNIIIGGDETIKVQSMTTTNTNDTEACVSQAKRIINAGGELVRLTTQGRREAENMKNISDALKAEGIMTPLVADVHFNANVDFRLSDKVSLGVELQATTLNDHYNSKRAGNADWYFNALAGVKYNLGKTYTTRKVEPVAPVARAALALKR